MAVSSQAKFECQSCKDIFSAKYYKRGECGCGKNWVEQPKGCNPRASTGARLIKKK